MQITLSNNNHITIWDGGRKEVSRLFNALSKEGATKVLEPQLDPDLETWFADMDLPTPRTHALYTCLRAVARSLQCAIYLDYGTKGVAYLRFKGVNAHKPELYWLACDLVINSEYVKSYHHGMSVKLTDTSWLKKRQTA